MELSERIENLMQRVQKPVRYMGGEFGAVMKDPEQAKVRYAFLFPDTYEVGMSHLGHAHPLSCRQSPAGRVVRARVYAVGGHGGRDARGGRSAVFRWRAARPCANSTFWA